eukprot:Lankesteria_metandrocarpae@DN1620_c0_g1_i1.p1
MLPVQTLLGKIHERMTRTEVQKPYLHPERSTGTKHGSTFVEALNVHSWEKATTMFPSSTSHAPDSLFFGCCTPHLSYHQETLDDAYSSSGCSPPKFVRPLTACQRKSNAAGQVEYPLCLGSSPLRSQ